MTISKRALGGVRALLFVASISIFYVLFGAFSSQESQQWHHRSKRDVPVLDPVLDFFLPKCNKLNASLPVDEVIDADAEPAADDEQFPPDFFTLEQRRQGAVAFHVCGLIYMFVCLAIVCDEFFVPSLAVLTEKLDISDDVAGATFMAAGGSAPEFFTSVIGVFIAQNNVGIGTIVGSATFNILCVLAFCTLFSKSVLDLTWWPLFRDVSIYMLALSMLVLFFMDEQITCSEAASMFVVYILYCTIMKFNVQLEIFVKTKILRQDLAEVLVETEVPVEDLKTHIPVSSETYDSIDKLRPEDIGVRRRSSARRQSLPILHAGSMFRTGIVQLMNHTLEQLPEGSEEGDSSQNSPAKNHMNGHPNVVHANGQMELAIPEQHHTRRPSHIEEIKSLLEEEEEQPLNMEWPDEWKKRLTYVLLAPVLVPMWVTIPDVRKQECRKWYMVTFVNSILWIAFFSYLMVWWANTIGETMGLPAEIIGLTILAAGTSIPDLITSVIVARKNMGDMAVSSSVGSNIFDVCVGLPVPWLLYFFVQFVKHPAQSISPISVSSKGLICSVGTLFIMLIILVAAIVVSNWKMNKIFGVIMILSYVAFCVFSVSLEMDVLKCPLNLC